MEYDVIGDIHGQAGKLDSMLQKLGYVAKGGGWTPPHGRQAIFLGDLIDRGPEQIKVVDTVRHMIDAGHARSVMGNHEYNAIGFTLERHGKQGEYLRRHSDKNLAQHKEFLEQVGLGSAKHREMIAWFRTLPPFLDLGGIRVVHAWWHQPYVDLVGGPLSDGRPMSNAFLYNAYDQSSAEYLAMEGLTKGLEVTLPSGHSFQDHGGVVRREVRTRWWHESPRTYQDVAFVPEGQEASVPNHPLPDGYMGQPVEGPPVFIGHYWMTGAPQLQASRVVCVDYSAAKDGPLVCYRWSGEPELDVRNFVEAG